MKGGYTEQNLYILYCSITDVCNVYIIIYSNIIAILNGNMQVHFMLFSQMGRVGGGGGGGGDAGI